MPTIILFLLILIGDENAQGVTVSQDSEVFCASCVSDLEAESRLTGIFEWSAEGAEPVWMLCHKFARLGMRPVHHLID